MTEHLKRQLEGAASECRTAKRDWREADKRIHELEEEIDTAKQKITAYEASIDNARVAIAGVKGERERAHGTFVIANERLSFLNRELIADPFA